MPRTPASQSRLSAAQKRALLAVKAGKVVRRFQHRSSALTCPGIGSVALWALMRDHLIQNGPLNDDRCVMMLTMKGYGELDLILREAPPAADDRSAAVIVAAKSRASS